MATVDGTTITKKTYERWAKGLQVAQSQSQSETVKNVTLPDPPDFKQCVADKRAKLPKPGKGQKATPDTALKKQCSDENKQTRDQVMGILVSQVWLKGEAKEQDVDVSKKDLDKNYDTLIKQQFPKQGDLQKWFTRTGLTEDDLRADAETQLLGQKITEKLQKDAGNVSDKDISNYYAENKERFAQPETRDLRVILTKTEDKADAAKAAVEGGTSFADAAKEYSIDPTSKAKGGVLEGVAKGQQEQALDKAVFGADKGELTGPVKTQFGYYVFEVTKSNPASQQTLEEAKATIKQQLTAQNQQKAQSDFGEKFQKEWRGKTECASAYKTIVCSNGPKPTPTPSAAQQQVPQQTQQGG